MTRDGRGRNGPLLGVGAVVALVLCCGLPVLVSAGILTGAGALLGNLFLVVGGLALGVGIVVWAARRSRRGAGCAVSPPTDAGAAVGIDEARERPG